MQAIKIPLLLLALLFPAAAFAQLDRVEETSNAPMRISFKPGTAELEPGSDRMLHKLKDYLSNDSTVTLLRIEGHVFGEKNNMELSRARAMAVARWLVSKGIDCKRLVAVGFGDTHPVREAGDPHNSRIGFINLEKSHRRNGNESNEGQGKLAGDPCKS
jgi:OOP family OmpA-OmpF porin